MKEQEIQDFLGEPEQSDDINAFLDEPVEAPIKPEQQEAMTHFPEEKRKSLGVRLPIITENIKKGFSDFAAIPGYAVDIVNWPLHKLGITPEDPGGGSEMIRAGWRLLTDYQEVVPENATERYAAKISEFAGSSIVPSTALVGKLAKGGATAKELSGVIGTEAASVVTGGVGAEFWGEVAEQFAGEEARPIGEITGGVSLGMLPIYFKTAGGTIWNALRTAKSIRNNEAMSTIAENTAKKQLSRMIGEDPQAGQNLKRAMALESEIPGFKPSLGAATGSKGVMTQQAALNTKSIENYNQALDNVRKANEAIDNYYQRFFKLSGKQLTAKRVFRETEKALKQQADDIQKQIDDLAREYKRKPTDEIGARLRELRQIRKSKVKMDVNSAYADLYKAADDLGIVDDASDLYMLAQDFMKNDETVFQTMPGVYRKMINIFGQKVDPDAPLEGQKIMASFRQLHSLSKEVSREYGKSLKSGDSAKSYYLGQVNELLDRKLVQFDDPVYGTFAKHKHSVDQFWLNEYHNVFRKGVGGRIANETKFGYETPDEQIVSRLVMKKGTAKGLNEFNKLYEGMPEAQGLLRDGILDMFSSKVINKGKIDQGQVRTFLNDYREVFDQLPDLRNVFMNSDALTTALVNRKAQVIRKTSLFANKNLSPYAQTNGFGSADEAVEAGLRDPKIMRVLTRNAKGKELEDITTLVANHILEKPNPWKFIIENESQLSSHFNRLKPGHFKHLKNVAEAKMILGRYDPTKYTPEIRGIKDTFWEKTGTTFSSAVAQWRWALWYNKTGAYYPAVDMGSKYFYKMRQGQIEKLMERSLYDPDLAKTMSELSQIKSLEKEGLKAMELLSDLGRHAINNGIRTGVAALPDESLNEQFTREVNER